MNTRMPTERTLPDKDQLLARVLADETSGSHRRWPVPVAAAAAVGMIAGGLAVGSRQAGDDRTGGEQPPVAGRTSPVPATSPATPTSSPDPGVPTNGKPLSAAQARALAKACATMMKGTAGEIRHAIWVRSPDHIKEKAFQSVIVANTARAGSWFACHGFPTRVDASGKVVPGVDASEQDLTVRASHDATHPVVPGNGGSFGAWIELDAKPDPIIAEAWHRVDTRVARLRQRIVVNGEPGPWYVADAVDGWVFLRSWDISTVLRMGDKVRLETQTLDRTGKLLDAPADMSADGTLAPSPGTTRVDARKVVPMPGAPSSATLEPDR